MISIALLGVFACLLAVAAWAVRGRLARADLQRSAEVGSAERAALTIRLTERDTELARLRESQTGLEAAAEQRRLHDVGIAEARAREKELAIEALRTEASALRERVAEIEALRSAEKRAMEQQFALLEASKVSLSDHFKAISAEILERNGQAFLEVAKASIAQQHEAAKGDLERREVAIGALVQPVKESLAKLDQKIGQVELDRVGERESLLQTLKQMNEAQQAVRAEAGNLVKALRTPNVRGVWGEMQLKRVVELAGMLNHCDFDEQDARVTDGRSLRPDLVVRLPGDRCIFVDAKTPLLAYLDGIDAHDENAKKAKLRDHARQLRDKITQLSDKEYWAQAGQAPEFTILFLPGESILTAALECDPSLLEWGFGRSVIVATPMTLIAVLKAAAYGWKQQTIATKAREVSELGAELYRRLADFGEHMERIGSGLASATQNYNRAVGSLESRVLVQARRFEQLAAKSGKKEIATLEPVEVTPRAMESREPAGADVDADSPI
jgi:DNA recombination protein RmuC